MLPSIPANQFVNVIPSVLAAGAPALQMSAMFLDNTGDTSVPIGTVEQFGSALAVSQWYGSASPQAAMASVYFAGYNGGTQLPSLLYFAQYNTAAVAAFARSGALTGITLAQLQALAGTITININGDVITSANINLATASSFTNAAALIQAGLDASGDIWNGTITTVNANAVITVNATTSGAIHVGDTIASANLPAGTTVQSYGTYTVASGVGTLNMSANATAGAGPTPATVSSTATCTYDNLRNAFVIKSPTTGPASTIAFPTTNAFTTGLLLTAATGGVLSQGAAAAVPAALMNSIVAQTQNWATFTTVQDPDAGAAGGPVKLAFATWNAAQNSAYMYVAYDSDPAAGNGADPASFGQLVNPLVGTDAIWSPAQGALTAAMHCAITASIDFDTPGGRTTFAFRSSPALVPDITNLQTYLNVVANKYNCYADVATRTAVFQWIQPGSISGPWGFIDSYVNQIFWNEIFQNDFAELLTQVPAIPYTQAGYNMIREALSADIQAMGAFGAWVPGVQLSGSQIVAVNTAAGLNIAPILQSRGWYLQISDPGAAVRATRGSPNVTFWYTDGGSVQQINMGSVAVL